MYNHYIMHLQVISISEREKKMKNRIKYCTLITILTLTQISVPVIASEFDEIPEAQIDFDDGMDEAAEVVTIENDEEVADTEETTDGIADKNGVRNTISENVTDFCDAEEEFTDNAGETTKTIWDGTITSNNLSANNYTTWSSTKKSYIVAKSNGAEEIVQYVPGKGVQVGEYQNGKFQSGLTLEMELPLFGGFYSGSNYNFLVFGQENPNNDNNLEVMRVVRYSKDWTRIDDCRLCELNTNSPFAGGSLDMTEVGSKLIIHTCHIMYGENGGGGHQASMKWVFDENTMKPTYSTYQPENTVYGYCSHSFAQLIETDGTNLYSVDHGDAYPRGVQITKTAVDGNQSIVSQMITMTFRGITGNNETGASIGGMALSSDNILIVGNSVDQSSDNTWDPNGQRNIFLNYASKDFRTTDKLWLTHYDDGVSVRTPQIVKINDNQFMVLWEEVRGSTTTKMVIFDGSGKQLSQIISSDVRLSDCKPVISSDGCVEWYVTNGSSIRFYKIDPNNFDAAQKTVIVASDITKKYSAEDQTFSLGASTLDGSTLTYSSSSGKVKVSADGQVTVVGGFQGTSTITLSAAETAERAVETMDITILVKASSQKTQTINISDITKEYSAEDRTFDLGATALDNAKLTYGSNCDRVRISADGQVTIIGGYHGIAVITVYAEQTAEYKSAKKNIAVMVKAPQPKTQKITASSVEKPYSAKAQTFFLEATALGNAELSYMSSSDQVTVSEDGQVTISGGYTGITVISISAAKTSEYKAAVKTITVMVKRPTSLTTRKTQVITANNITKAYSEKKQSFSLGASALGGVKLTYTSSSSSVEVMPNGQVTIAAGFSGKATITVSAAATSTYSSAAKTITVEIKENQKALKKQEITASGIIKTYSTKAQTFNLNVKAYGGAKLTYISSSKYVKISASGKVTVAGKFVGKATITIKASATSQYDKATKKITITVKPATPKIVKITAGAKQFTVKWKKDASVSGCQMQYSTNAKFSSAPIKALKNSAAGLTCYRLKKGKTYYIRLRSYKKDSSGTVYSNWSNTQSIKIK